MRPGRYVRPGVADGGMGMDERRWQAVEPFFSTKGIGLGLSIVHGPAAQLGGGLAIDSAPGRGASVELWSPISATDADADADAVPLPPTARPKLLRHRHSPRNHPAAKISVHAA